MLQTPYDLDEYDEVAMAWKPIAHYYCLRAALQEYRAYCCKKSLTKYRVRQKNDGDKKINKIIISNED
jgi:hypothetical protein